MSLHNVKSFAAGQWISPDSSARPFEDAVTGKVIGHAGNSALDVQAMLDHARTKGGPALRALTFHNRARMVKALALHLKENKQALYDLSFSTGATHSDTMIDVDGGITTMLVFASKGRHELPDDHIYLDGEVEQLSRTGTFLGHHIATPLQGAAIQINAFNFPVWGMLEKLAPTLIAGVPAIVKPATTTCYVTECAIKLMLDSGILPEGALQFVAGGLGDMLDHLNCQDIVSFTGSADTALKLRSAPHILANSIRFMAEQDSLNASILGPDASPDTPEFALFIREVHREMTTKAGQKCTAARRIIAPEAHVPAVIDALSERLSKTVIGDPKDKATRMGALVNNGKKRDVLEKAAIIATEATQIYGDPDNFTDQGADANAGAFLPPMLFHCEKPNTAQRVHNTEAFGPVSTIMGYSDLDHAIALVNRGGGSLVASVITHDPGIARHVALGAGAFHGRLYFNKRDSMAESTGHGAPLPHLVHGGPGRAGGGEEMGGVRGVMHYMQRTSIQGSPDILTAVGGKWTSGATENARPEHLFKRGFYDLAIGDTLHAGLRKITMDDIEHFTTFTGGLDNLRFMKPVQAGDSISVRLAVKHKTPRNHDYGEFRWHVSLTNQDADLVAEYDLLTMDAYQAGAA